MLELVVAVIWICCGILAYGITFAHFQENWPDIKEMSRREDVAFSIVVGLFGLAGLLSIFLCSGFAKHGIRFR